MGAKLNLKYFNKIPHFTVEQMVRMDSTSCGLSDVGLAA